MSATRGILILIAGWLVAIPVTWYVACNWERSRIADEVATRGGLNAAGGREETRPVAGGKTGSDRREPSRNHDQASKADVRNVTGTVAKAIDLQKAIRELCEAGKFEEAWASIKEDPGLLRESQIGAFFGCASKTWSSNDLLAQMEVLKKDGYSGERLVALSALFEVMHVRGVEEIIGAPGWSTLVNEMKGEYNGQIRVPTSLGSMLKMRLGGGEDPAGILELGEVALSKGALDGMNFAELVSASPKLNSSQKSEILLNVLNGDAGPDSNRDVMIAQVMAEDPVQGVNEIASSSKMLSRGELATAVASWSTVDPKAAHDWFAANGASLSDDKLDQVSRGFCDSAILEGSRQIAMMWVERVKNETVRKELVARIDKSLPSEAPGSHK
jgi:hypothetical protein